MRPAPGAVALSPARAGLTGAEGGREGNTEPPTLVMAKAVPAPTKAPMIPPPTAAGPRRREWLKGQPIHTKVFAHGVRIWGKWGSNQGECRSR